MVVADHLEIMNMVHTAILKNVMVNLFIDTIKKFPEALNETTKKFVAGGLMEHGIFSKEPAPENYSDAFSQGFKNRGETYGGNPTAEKTVTDVMNFMPMGAVASIEKKVAGTSREYLKKIAPTITKELKNGLDNLVHYTKKGGSAKISTNPERLIPNSISTGVQGNTSAGFFGSKRIPITLDKGSKILDINKKTFEDIWNSMGESSPMDVGKVLYEFAKENGIDAIKVSGKIHGLGDEYAIINPSKFRETKGMTTIGTALGASAVSSLFVNPTEGSADPEIPKAKTPKIVKTVKSLYGNVHEFESGNQVRDVHPKLKTEIANTYINNPDLPKGVIEALLMKESSMGYDDNNKNKDIGEYAWLGGMTRIAKKELIRHGIVPDLNTKQGVLDAMAKFWLIKSKGDPDILHTYNFDYSSGKLDDKKLNQFKEMYDYYSNN